jgi:SAM-dependent methyltransferase
MKCRHCKSELEHPFLDLGFAPPSNAYLSFAQLKEPEITFPLQLRVCHHCWLVQTEDYAKADELFTNEYAYFSSTSQGWLNHAKNYADMITQRLALSPASFVLEIASNDGYLLKNFAHSNIPCLGVEPTESTATAAEKIGLRVMRAFFGVATATDIVALHQPADLICGNNVYAHVPDINDFTSGLKIALKPGGTINLEFPHLLRLVEQNQFDTIYHEHYSYLSLTAVSHVFRAAGLRIYDVEQLPTHGGSLRIYGCHADDKKPTAALVETLAKQEHDSGLLNSDLYKKLQRKAERLKNDFSAFLLEQNRLNKTVAGYGAAAKGNTLMNYAGVRPDLIDFVCDAALAKQGKFMPGSHIPIYPPSELAQRKPDFVVIFPWNIAEEVIHQHGYIKNWGGKFVVAVPQLRIL